MGARLMLADAEPGFPCRVSLEDAKVGETVLLLPYTHHDVGSPYRASGPVFVRRHAAEARLGPGEVPQMLRHRLLSVRAYDAVGFSCEAPPPDIFSDDPEELVALAALASRFRSLDRKVLHDAVRLLTGGDVASVDFHWYLDVQHGADYFRRWHALVEHSGGLFVHKATHHFDLLNWWVDSEPELVFGLGELDYYGANNPYRHTNCRGCPHADQCPHYWDITRSQSMMNLYVEHEHHDGYLRDGCVWDEEIDSPDKMGASIRYKNGTQVSWSCTTYSPYEGYRIAFNGTKGRMDAWIKERQPWEEAPQDEIRVSDNFGESEVIVIPHGGGGHGGGDTRLKDRIFRDPSAPDPYHQAANARDGVMSILIGIAALKSSQSGEAVRIADLTSLDPLEVRPKAV